MSKAQIQQQPKYNVFSWITIYEEENDTAFSLGMKVYVELMWAQQWTDADEWLRYCLQTAEYPKVLEDMIRQLGVKIELAEKYPDFSNGGDNTDADDDM